MISTATAASKLARAGKRGAMKNRQLIAQIVAKGTVARHLTLPPGSVRGYPFRGQNNNGSDGYLSDGDDYYQSDSRSRVQVSMTPKGRSYGTLDTFAGTTCYPVVHTATQSTYNEDYDAWGMHTAAAGETTYDLGTPASSDYAFVEHSLHQISFPTEDSDAASAPFPVLEDDELQEYMTTFYDGGMDVDDHDVDDDHYRR